jgi:hypothetical protein
MLKRAALPVVILVILAVVGLVVYQEALSRGSRASDTAVSVPQRVVAQ